MFAWLDFSKVESSFGRRLRSGLIDQKDFSKIFMGMDVSMGLSGLLQGKGPIH